MAKRHVYAKDSTGFGDFVYVDLLPDVRRSTQFNMNVIIGLLFGIVLMFVFIYLPYSTGVTTLEELNSINSDLQHEFVLTQEEFDGYEIDLDAINFGLDIDEAKKVRINFNNYVDDIQILVSINNGRIRSITYNAENKQLIVDVSNVEEFSFNLLNNQILNKSWVDYSTKSDPVQFSDELEYTATFTIGVDYDAE